MAKVIGIIQARLGSERLPAKILAPLAGRTMLELLATRLLACRSVSEWWLATTHEPADDVTECWGHALGLRVFRGEVDDVLSRFTAIIRERSPEWVVRVTGDNPFVSSEVVDLIVDARDTMGKERPLLQLAGRDGQRCLPLGFGVQLARAEAVLASEAEIPEGEPHHRSHVLSWLAQHSEPHCAAVPNDWPARPQWRWTVDTVEDLAMARSAFSLFGLQSPTIGYREMVALLDQAPEIPALNQHVAQKPIEAG